MSERSRWSWSVVVEAKGRRYPMSGTSDGPTDATEDKIRNGIEAGVREHFPNGYQIVKCVMTRTN